MTHRAADPRRARAVFLAAPFLLILANTGWADGTRVQHDWWIRKHSVLELPLGHTEHSPVNVMPAPHTRETRPQHQLWARKFQTPDGSLDGTRLRIVVRRSEADVRQLMRCEMMDQQDLNLEQLAGC